MTVSAEWDVLKANDVFLFLPGTDKPPIEDADRHWNQSIVHYHRDVLSSLGNLECLSLKLYLSIFKCLSWL